MAGVGATIERAEGKIVIHGGKLREPASQLDAGNSGSTIRMLSGILAGQSFPSRITGDDSLARRPMDRIVQPLTEMGARVGGARLAGRKGTYPPLMIHGTRL